MESVLVITDRESDMLCLMKKLTINLHVLKPNELAGHDLNQYNAFMILGGTNEKPLLFKPQDRIKIEDQFNKSKKFFVEYCTSIMDYYFDAPVSSRYERMICSADGEAFAGIPQGTLLENQYNSRIAPYYCREDIKPLLLISEHTRNYRSMEVTDQMERDLKKGIWLESNGNVMICTFRICDFIKARFTPSADWMKLAGSIVKWICGRDVDWTKHPAAYRVGPPDRKGSFERDALAAADGGIGWYWKSGVLLDKGAGGVYEGIRSEIMPDGKQEYNRNIRADCNGESALPFLLHYLYSGDRNSLVVADNLMKYVFDLFLCRDGRFQGMLRWTAEAWCVCYQDDVARAILPALLRCLYTGERAYFAECEEALNFLVRTTGTDGLRVSRTDNMYIDEDAKFAKLAETPGKCTSPNYNAYYLATLLLAYKLGGKQIYKEIAVKGISAMMAVYPNLDRIQSETHDLCRMILPLAYLYWVTGEEEHRNWLYRVTKDLERLKHPSGGYLEWDSDNSADLHDAGKDSESAVFSNNGDPVVDSLYAVNWLPIAFMQAYFITSDEYFMKLWRGIAEYMVSTQIHSADPMLNGAWVRAMDVDLMEVYGLPDDVGWGPWCVETGWSMSEIIGGLYMGLIIDKLKGRY